MYETNSEWFVIVNPHAGSGKTMSQWTVAESLLRERGVRFTAVFTEYKSHARELALRAARDGRRRVLAAGGDGSVHELFSGLLDYCLESGVPAEEFLVGNIPIGSGNDWLRSLGVPRDVDTVVRLVAEGARRTQDLVCVRTSDGRSCCMANIGGAGFDSHVCERVNARKERGHRSKWIYLGSLIVTILKLKRLNVEVTGDGEVLYSGPCYSIAFGNGSFSGGGMRQTASAVMDDGLVDVLVVPVISLFRILREVHRLFDGTTPESQYLVYRQCREITVTPLDPFSSASGASRPATPVGSSSANSLDSRSASSVGSSSANSLDSRSADPTGSLSGDILEVDGEIEGRLPATVSATSLRIGVVAPRR